MAKPEAILSQYLAMIIFMLASPNCSSSAVPRKNDVAIQVNIAAFEGDEGGEIRGEHTFVIERAAAQI